MKPLGRWAVPLARIYGAVVARKNAQFDSGVRAVCAVRELRGPVVSVGNISAGGSGKTPFVMMLAELLHERGIAVDVLSRGYRRKTRGVLEVRPEGDAAEFGDEPLLMARRLDSLGIPVIVGEDRHAAGMFAEAKFGARLHLLDDGFQHRQLGREFDIVLVSDADARDCLLPAGHLREPLSSLARANAVVLEESADGSAIHVALRPGTQVWRTRRTLSLHPVVGSAARPVRPLAFCGVGKPATFFVQLRSMGMKPAAEREFGDHHAYFAADVAGLLQLARKTSADGFVTTEKDLINLGALAERLNPLWVARLQVELDDADDCIVQLLRVLAERGKPAPLLDERLG